MASLIDPTVPAAVSATTASVRLQFSRAKAEIEALQAQVVALQGAVTTLQEQVAGLLAPGDPEVGP